MSSTVTITIDEIVYLAQLAGEITGDPIGQNVADKLRQLLSENSTTKRKK